MPTKEAKARLLEVREQKLDRELSTAPAHDRQRKANSKKAGRLFFTERLIEQLRAHQRGRCAICQVELTLGRVCDTRECADHCHLSGLPRGLLCATCNFSLGMYERKQAPRGVCIAIYDRYLDLPPANVVDLAYAPDEDEA